MATLKLNNLLSFEKIFLLTLTIFSALESSPLNQGNFSFPRILLGLKGRIEQTRQKNLAKIEYISTMGVSQNFSNKLQELLLSRMELLDKIKRTAQSSISNYKINENIEPFHYYNRRHKPPNPVKIEPTFSTKVLVNLNRSYVQCSTEIYVNSTIVLNIANATMPLDDVYLQNFQKHPDLLWQFFCSAHGILRTFPGRNTNREVDLYDCRRRLWYNQAINSPKDVVLALDLSGSMTGYHFVIAKLIAQSLIETLQQDDFFNIVKFNSKAELIIPCIQQLSQATSYNKNAFKAAITELPDPTGIADFPAALEKSFQLLKESSRSELTSSGCTKIIMLISDGIDSDVRISKILEQYNGDKEVVIFSYKIGEQMSGEMKDIACSNGGNYYEFPTVGNVLDGVLKYQESLSRPLGRSSKDYVIFTPLYLDGSGLGMMTTISTAVFSEKTGELIGVAGMDIVVSLLQEQYPLQKMGVFGHAFAINNNGLFLMHPKFKDQTGYLPDPATVYLDEVEYTTDPSKAKELKKEMINGETGCMEGIESDWLYPKNINRRVVRLNNTYCYQSMNNTPFFAGVSIPQQNMIQLVAVPEKASAYVRSGIDALVSGNPNQRPEIAKWLFCDIDTEGEKKQPASIKYYPTARDLYDYLNDTDVSIENSTCDQEMLLTLLLSASIVANFTKDIWNDTFFENLPHVLDVYIITTAGYTTMFSSDTNQSTPLNRDIFEDQRFSHPASFFQKKDQEKLIFTVNFTNDKPKPLNDTEQYVSLGKTIFSETSDVLLAVTGATVSSTLLYDILIQSNPSCDSSSGDSTPTRKSCYLVDENGYVVVSNQGNYQVGYFLGNFDGRLIEELVESKIFEKRIYNDTQADCHIRQGDSKNSASVTLKTFYQNILNIGQLIVTQFISLLWWLFMNMTVFESRDSLVYGSSQTLNISCTKQIQIYLLVNDSISYRSNITCDVNCKQSISVESVNGTNLALVVTEDSCIDDRSCPKMITSNDPVETEDIDICDRPKHYRKTLSVCYNSTGADTQCFYKYKNTEPSIVVYIVVFLSLCFAMSIALVVSYYCRRYVHGKF